MPVEKKITKPTAFVHIDCDGIASVASGKITGENTDVIFFSSMPRILEMLYSFNCRATFFVVARDLEDHRKKDILRQVVALGHSIGSHTYSHPDLTTVSPEQMWKEIVKSKTMIQDTLGIDVVGFRAPGYKLNRRILYLLEEAGYRYDSSVYPDSDFAKRMGFSKIYPNPFIIGKNGTLYEFPLPKYMNGLVPWHASYSIFLGYPYYSFNYYMHRLRRNYLICLYHLIDFSDPVPRKYLKSFKEKILSGSMCQFSRKGKICKKILSTVFSYYNVMKTEEFLSET